MSRIRRYYGVITCLGFGVTGGCAPKFIAPTPAPAHAARPVAASFERTWNATIDVFARNALSIATIEKASGIVVAAPVSLDTASAQRWVDCGRLLYQTGRVAAYLPTVANFNVLVRDVGGDRSTVLVTASWAWHEMTTPAESRCETRGVFESDLERKIQQAAESGS